MEKNTAVLRRMWTVCARNGCFRCRPYDEVVPEDCEFEILHALELGPWCPGVQEYERRSGKSVTLCMYANYLVASGEMVYLVVRKEAYGRMLREPPYEIDGRVVVVSQFEVPNVLSGSRPGYVLVDEITPDELRRNVFPFMGENTLLAAWFTGR